MPEQEQAAATRLTDEQQQRVEALRHARLILAARGALSTGTIDAADVIRVAWWITDGRDTYIDGPADAEQQQPTMVTGSVAVDADDLRRLANIRDNWIHNRAGASAVNLALQAVLNKYADQLEAGSRP